MLDNTMVKIMEEYNGNKASYIEHIKNIDNEYDSDVLKTILKILTLNHSNIEILMNIVDNRIHYLDSVKYTVTVMLEKYPQDTGGFQYYVYLMSIPNVEDGLAKAVIKPGMWFYDDQQANAFARAIAAAYSCDISVYEVNCG